MAKRKTTKRKTTKRKTNSYKKSKNNSLILNFLKQTGIWGCVIFVGMIALLFAIDYLGKDHSGFRKQKETKKTPGIEMPKEQPKSEKPTRTKDAPSVSDRNKRGTGREEKKSATGFRMPQDAEIPKLLAKRPEQIIEHEGYVVSYNSHYKIANWVAYELTDEEVNNKNVERSNKFVKDPMVEGATALNEDYTRTGFDRGHLAPAGDMRWSAKAMRESFYLSNICPQHPDLNRGIWKTLEEQIRVWALDHKAVYIATGPVIPDNKEMRVMGKNRVGVPEYFYKVVAINADEHPVGIGFIFENKNYKNTTLQSMVITVDSVEKVTGIDFFHTLPRDIQEKMESRIEWEYWRF